ncbi:MAG: membrane protein insertase YidC [Campylobacteraceae bacterium]|jgi:YidC/Oxa1 family membrane protein insertase|nr:membrane protein insertase YidC [Campylobacteraceae bacterium]
MGTQQRLLLAIVLAFAFFVIYGHFLAPKNPQEVSNNTTNQTVDQQAAPLVQTSDDTKSSVVSTTTSQNAVSGEIIAKVFADQYELHIDRLGRISKYYLNGENFKDENGERIQLLDASFNLLPLEIRFTDTITNNEAFMTPYKSDISEVRLDADENKTVVLTQELSSTVVTKKITFTQNAGYNVDVELTSPLEYFITPGFRPNVVADGYTFHGAIIQKPDKSIEKIEDGDAKKTFTFENARFTAASDRYYTTLLANFDNGFSTVVSSKDNNPNVFIRGKSEMSLTGYIGPKSRENIHAVNKELDPVIEYGFFTAISKPLFSLLYFLHDKIGNWGWAIVILTILIRLVLYPLTYKGMVSMNKLKELAPKVKELQNQYKDDKQKLNVKMMELYKKHGANPMGGCLPILIQIPIFFAIYRVLLNAIELKNAPWILWIEDLAIKDPYFVLPILMGLTMYLQQRLTPTNFIDPMQEKIMRMLPIIFTFFFIWFPAGLTLYWFINNLFSVFQQLYVNRIFDKKKEAAELAKKEKQ